jgi:hypothetical protein
LFLFPFRKISFPFTYFYSISIFSWKSLKVFTPLSSLLNNVTLTAGQPDRLIWCLNSDGIFSVSSAYELHFIASTRFACAKPIWKYKSPIKYRSFMWLVVHRLTRFNPGNAHAWGLSRHEELVGSGELDGDQTAQGNTGFT